jgi:signal transduction histidine kinase
VSCAPSEDPDALTALVDAERLRQALENLAINARDAMRQGGELRFAVSRVHDAPAISATDARAPTPQPDP